VDPNRVVPANFAVDTHQAYLALPAAALPSPDAKLVGKSNYTIRDRSGRVVQVHLANRVFFAKKITDGEAWDRSKDGSPQISWGSDVSAAWDAMVSKIGGWDV
jgi:hypothetical protein